MTDMPLLNDEYREAFLYLIDQMEAIMSCSDNKELWFPENEDRFLWAIKVYSRCHPEIAINPILDFPWPEKGTVPNIPTDYIKKLAEAEKKKLTGFIERNIRREPFSEN
jgi:hypothetical protein